MMQLYVLQVYLSTLTVLEPNVSLEHCGNDIKPTQLEIMSLTVREALRYLPDRVPD